MDGPSKQFHITPSYKSLFACQRGIIFKIKTKDTNRKIGTTFFIDLLCLNFGSKFLPRHAQRLLYTAHIASDFTCVYSTAAGTIFGTTDVQLGN